MDVDGTDATQKLAILSHLAFGVWVPWKEIPRTGIDTVDIDLIAHGDKEPSAGLHVRDEGGGGGGGQACDVGENDDVNAHEGGGIEAISSP